MKRILALLTAMILCLPLTACGGRTGGEETTNPALKSGAPVESGLPDGGETEQTAPVEYDFSGVEIDEYTRTLTGFEGLPWGDKLPQELVEDLGGQKEIILRKPSVPFAGLNFQAEQMFSYDRSIPDLEEEERALILGTYTRMGYVDLKRQNDREELAISDFNQVMAYLTELYGQPTSYTLHSVNGSDQKAEELTAPLTVEQFWADGVQVCRADWRDLDGADIILALDNNYGGYLYVMYRGRPSRSGETLG